jgi:MFS family permease
MSSLTVPRPATAHWPAWRALLAISVGTTLSLMGDTAMYAVLPTHVAEAGVTLASVGLLLSANRWIRLLLNGPAGVLYDRWPRRWFFIPALFVGALSTALYGWTTGLWPLLIGRLLWGVAWSGIWVGGNTIILDVTREHDRGRWAGLYQLSFFLGGVIGSPLGGLLTDLLGFHPALRVAAIISSVGAVLALLLLPETRGLRASAAPEPLEAPVGGNGSASAAMSERDGLVAATLLYGANRFAVAGVLTASLGLVIQAAWGDVHLASGAVIGIATLTGVMLGLNPLTSMLAAPLAGHWSDRWRSRWAVAAWGLLPGALGMALLATVNAWAVVPGVVLVAVASGSNQSLATAVLGDVTADHRRGRAMGWMHTFGDLSSAAAPLLVYAALPWLGLGGIFLASAGLLVVVLAWAWRLARRYRPVPFT